MREMHCDFADPQIASRNLLGWVSRAGVKEKEPQNNKWQLRVMPPVVFIFRFIRRWVTGEGDDPGYGEGNAMLLEGSSVSMEPG
jgi:hypothetical protein